MCLDSITENLTPTAMIQSGWKEFSGSRSDPQFWACNYKGKDDVPLDKWISAEKKPVAISGWRGIKYESGFHIYTDETQLKLRGNKRRVYFRNAHTCGPQDSLTVVIAQEMYVPSDPDDWPPQ